MTRFEVGKLLAFLANVYPGKVEYPKPDKKGTELMENTWLEFLKPFDSSTVEKATNKYINSGNKWPPSIGELAKMSRELQKPDDQRLTAEEAWEKFQRAARVIGSHRADEAMGQLPPRVQRTLEIMGGFVKVATAEDDRGFVQRRFEDIYNNLTETEKERELLPGSSNPKIAGRRDELTKKLKGGS